MEKRISPAERMDTWALDFVLTPGQTGVLLEAQAAEGEALTVSFCGELQVTLHTRWAQTTASYGKEPQFTFTLTAPVDSDHIQLRWRGYSAGLYVDGALIDEDWPLGELPGGEWLLRADDALEARLLPCPSDREEPETAFEGPFQNFVFPGHNTGVGDCMPFARDGRYCLYCLLDRRGHRSKQGLGAHQWAQVSSPDLKRWTIHPLAVGITEQWEGSICTGSLIQKDGRTYAFYAVRMSDGSPARLTWAVSEDGVHFAKSGQYFALTEPYEPVSARDPMVFLGADGLYHMLVTTSLVNAGRFAGCLAHLTSPNLTDWVQQAPFIVPGYPDQPECSDYFEWNGWYYLVFSNAAVARYRLSRQPFGPWVRPENDLLDALEVQVPKTAAFGNRRFSTGFLARRPRGYAGNAVTHELFQRPDGTLGVRPLEEILPPAQSVSRPGDLSLEGGDGRAAATLQAQGSFRLKARLHLSGEGALCGLCLNMPGEGKQGGCRIELNPAARSVMIVRQDEEFSMGSGRDLLQGVDLHGEAAIDLLVSEDILDLMLPDGRCMTMRLDGNAERGVEIEFYALCGQLDVRGIELHAL